MNPCSHPHEYGRIEYSKVAASYGFSYWYGVPVPIDEGSIGQSANLLTYDGMLAA